MGSVPTYCSYQTNSVGALKLSRHMQFQQSSNNGVMFLNNEHPSVRNKTQLAKRRATINGSQPNPIRSRAPILCSTGMPIIFVATEVHPWCKTGGLGDVVGGLPPALAAMGHRVMTIAPRYDQYKDTWDTNVLVKMEYTCKSYQLGHGGNLMFEKDLKQLVEYLGRPYPEFFGIPLNNPSGGPPRWEVTADLRGSLGAPIWETIWFSVMGNTWKEGLVRAMQEAIARLCGQNMNQLKSTRFIYYPRHDPMGRPINMPPHPEMNHYVAYLDFMLYKTRKELDNALAFRQAHYP